MFHYEIMRQNAVKQKPIITSQDISKNRRTVPCHYGGLSAARKYSATDLGYIWRCNRVVSESGQRCYQHKDDDLRHEDDDGR